MKRILSFAMALVLVVSMIPLSTVPVWAATTVASGTCGAKGDNLTWTLDDEGTLTISGTGAMADYEWRNSPWYSRRRNIQKLVVEYGISTIGGHAFYECENLTSIAIPNSVTTIGEYAFGGCLNVSDLTIPDSVIYIRGGAFDGTSWLFKQASGLVYAGKVLYGYKDTCPPKITVKNGTLGITEYAFLNCDSLETITFPNSLKVIGDSAFFNCWNLADVTLPASITTIGKDAFGDCTSMKAIYMNSSNDYFCEVDGVLFNGDKTILVYFPSGRNGEYSIPNSVTTIGVSAFNHSHLNRVIFSNSVTTIEKDAFANCPFLANVEIGDSVTTIGEGAFAYCGSLTTAEIPDSVNTIGDGAFQHSNINSVYIPSSVITIGDLVFSGCDSLTAIKVDPNNENYCDIAGVLFSKNEEMLLCYPGGKSGEYSIQNSVTAIGYGAFEFCNHLTRVTTGSFVTTIGERAFYSCDSLASVTISNSVTAIGGHAFGWCEDLIDIYFNGSAPTIGNYAFQYVTATAYYYPDDTWTEDVMQDYGGNITWVARECPHSYTSVVTPPTCTEQGYTTHTCSKCGDSYKDTYVDASGHSYGKWETVDNTNHKRTCTACKTATETKTHDWDSGTIIIQPTCKETGIMTYSCPTCGVTKTETLPVTEDHKYGDWEMVDDTNHKRTCTVCKTATEIKPHNYSSVITPPTCTEQGYTTHSCPDCDYVIKDSYTEPAGHTFGDDNVCDTCGYMLGDFTGDGKVTADDVQHLLWYTVFPADYPLNGPADFDGDGVVTDKDVLLLLLYITLPALFPLPQLT